MIASALRSPKPSFDLPPAFSWVAPSAGTAVHAFACDVASRLGAGTLTSRAGEQVVELAVVLEPDEPLGTARRAFLICMAALADAVAACAPPERPVTLVYPDLIAFNGARLGGGRLGWPDDCADDQVPEWLVFSGMLIASKRHVGDPGLTPNSTSLEEEGFEPDAPDEIVEAFARYLMLAFDGAREHGFAGWSEAYRRWMPDGRTARIDDSGNLRAEDGSVVELAPALAPVAWLDPQTGTPRL